MQNAAKEALASLDAVRDGKMITAQTWQSHPDFYRLIFNALAE